MGAHLDPQQQQLGNSERVQRVDSLFIDLVSPAVTGFSIKGHTSFQNATIVPKHDVGTLQYFNPLSKRIIRHLYSLLQKQIKSLQKIKHMYIKKKV
uniref:Uncharacterized protein n=1 Tax=Anguilla anguilla TaxID=7936 RepID=A0A0E9XDG7_ANGAN